MKVGIIGAGKVGCALAIGLHQKGFDISGISSKSDESVKRLNAVLGRNFDNRLNSTVKKSDLVFIAVPDVQIAKSALEISNLFAAEDLRDKVFIHCSGALTSELLEPVKKNGGVTASLHPIQTFADRDEGWRGLENIYFGFEGDERALVYLREIVDAFNGILLTIKKEDKPLYHAAACILSNYTVALSYLAGKLFETIGVDPGTGVQALMPLLVKTVDNIQAYGSVHALTGPISRGDYPVVQGHLKAMEERIPSVSEIYKKLASITLQISQKKGTIQLQEAERIRRLIDS